MTAAASSSMDVVDETEWPTQWPQSLQTSSSSSSSSSSSRKPHTRVTSSAAHNHDQFLLKDQRFSAQFANFYFCRLKQLKPVLEQRVRDKWGAGTSALPIISKVTDIPKSGEFVVIGTLCKHMDKKPSVLDEYDADRETRRIVPGSNVVSASDSLSIEDEDGRLDLAGSALPVARLCTGCVVAIRGTNHLGSEIMATDICFPGPAPHQKPHQQEGGAASAGEEYVCLVSGLDFSSPDSDALAVQLMADYVTGFLGGSSEQCLASKISHVIIAGDSIHYNQAAVDELDQKTKAAGTGALSQACQQLDALMVQFASASIRVSVMPGASDPCTMALPQQPLHRCLLPRAATYTQHAKAMPNPAALTINHTSVLGCSGQNVDDMRKYCEAPEDIDFLELTWRCRNIAPTAPDTLAAHPFEVHDPFVIDECPHVYFASNQKQFQSRLVTGDDGQQTRLVMVPRFAESKTIVLVNINTLECHPIQFSTP